MTFVAIIIILITLKFIYDSYLTDNTESRYTEYKKTVYGIRTDGVYMFKQKGTSTWGEKFLITHILIFNTHGLVTYEELEGKVNLTKGDIKDVVLEFSKVTAKDDSCVRYVKKDNEIDIIFKGNKFPDRKTWVEKNLGANRFRGKVNHNNLHLAFENIYFDQTIGAPKSHKYFNNEKFTFFN
tara:strand:- start:382 stop:927 length:546 start_codon:yes stop_codon:yes gene_type:complete